MEFGSILVNIPYPTFEEADKAARVLLERELCGLVRIHKEVHQLYPEGNSIVGDDIALLTIKTTPGNLKAIESYVYETHPWGTPCIDAYAIVTDHC